MIVQHVAWAHQIAHTWGWLQEERSTPHLPPPLTHPPAPKKIPGGFGSRVNFALKKKTHKADGAELVWLPHLKDYLPNMVSKKGESCRNQKPKPEANFCIDHFSLSSFTTVRHSNALPHLFWWLTLKSTSWGLLRHIYKPNGCKITNISALT